MTTAFKRMKRCLACLHAMGLAVAASPVRAGLPTPADPSTVASAGDFMAYIKGYIKDGGETVILAVSLGALVWASWAAIAKFNEARNGKAEWAEVGLLAVVAAGILLFVSYLLDQANTVFA